LKARYNILVTGCGGDIGQSIGKVLKSHALFNKVIGCDMSDEHAGKFIFDKVARVPACTSDNYYQALKNIIEEEGIDILLPISEPELRMVALDPDHFSFPGVTLICANKKAMDIGFDKLATADFLRRSSLPFPETKVISDVSVTEFPVILKSRSGSGGKSIFVLKDTEEFEFFKKKYPGFIIQEYLDNDREEYTCGVFRSKEGGIRTIIYNRKLVDSYSAFGVVVHNEAVEDLLIKMAEALDLRGSINIQLRLSGKGPCVFEINPRFSSTVMFRHLMGFEDVIWSVQDALGLPLGDYTRTTAGTKFYKGFTEYVK